MNLLKIPILGKMDDPKVVAVLKKMNTTPLEVDECITLQFKEVWKSVNEHRGYFVSNLGRIKSKSPHRKSEIILKPMLAFGYLYVRIGYPKQKNIKIHRLVAQYFVKNPDGKKFVNHKDGNKKNNNSKNLEWVTSSENTTHAYKIGLAKAPQGEKHGRSKLTEKQVREILRFRNKLKMTHGEIAAKFNIARNTVTQIVNKIKWKHL